MCDLLYLTMFITLLCFLSGYSSELRKKHALRRSRLLAVVTGQVVVPFSLRNKVIPGIHIHGAFSDKYNEDNDSISITSSISSGVSEGVGVGVGLGGSDEENIFDDSDSNLLHGVKSASKKAPANHKQSVVSRRAQKAQTLKPGSTTKSSKISKDNQARSLGGTDDARDRGYFTTPPLILPPPPSYYAPPQYYTSSATPTVALDRSKGDSLSHTHDNLAPVSKVSFQKQAVALGYSNGRPGCTILVRLFMQEIVTHWQVYAKKHRDIRRLRLFLQSCTKLRRLSKRFYHWLVRSSSLAHRQSTWILPSQKQLPYYYKHTSSTPTLDRASLPQHSGGGDLSLHHPAHQQQQQQQQQYSHSTTSIRTKNNLSMGYAPPPSATTARSTGRNTHDHSSLGVLHPYSQQRALPASGSASVLASVANSNARTHVLYEQEPDTGGEEWEATREDLMDPYPLRAASLASLSATANSSSSSSGLLLSAPLASISVPAVPSVSVSGTCLPGVRGLSQVGPMASSSKGDGPTHNQLYEVGKFYLGHRNVQYSHVVSELL